MDEGNVAGSELGLGEGSYQILKGVGRAHNDPVDPVADREGQFRSGGRRVGGRDIGRGERDLPSLVDGEC